MRKDDRTISVHELTEFVFCRRAGIHAVEYPTDANPDIQAQRLDFSPDFSIGELWKELLRRIRSVAIVGVGGVAGIAITLLYPNPVSLLFAFAIVCLCWVFLKPSLFEIPTLCQMLYEANTAEPAEPKLSNRADEEIGW